MTKLSQGIFACLAVSLTLGAVAWGRDLSTVAQDPLAASEANVNINRAAKADRVAPTSAAAVPTRTISLRLDSLTDTSILIRVPVTVVARSGSSAPAFVTSGKGKMTVACEPIVSVLTEVAKRLQPGRCVT